MVNLSGQPAQARVPLDWPDLPRRSWQLTDILRQLCRPNTGWRRKMLWRMTDRRGEMG